MLQKIKGHTNKEKKEFVEITLKYPPRVKAFAGTILNEINPGRPIAELKKSINPLTIYEFGINKKQLFQDAVIATAQRFNIPEIYIEKDYWVTVALCTIFYSQ